MCCEGLLSITALSWSLGDLTTRIAKMAKTDVRILFNFTAAIGSNLEVVPSDYTSFLT